MGDWHVICVPVVFNLFARAEPQSGIPVAGINPVHISAQEN